MAKTVFSVWEFYEQHGRHNLPWRLPTDGSFDPYSIMVSEVMLQQTQVQRVIPKYSAFLATFPTVQALAAAPLQDVLRLWSGLGYNRRAKFLWQAARCICDEFDGIFPTSLEQLITLPGIGKNTAGAILAYAFDMPTSFLETNVRSVFIHHYFTNQQQITDAELQKVVQEALLHAINDDVASHTPRTWYWALMDYGSDLKKRVINPSRKSSSYAKQSKFNGSNRQVRGRVIKVLGDGSKTFNQLTKVIGDERLQSVLESLAAEGLIYKRSNKFYLGNAWYN